MSDAEELSHPARNGGHVRVLMRQPHHLNAQRQTFDLQGRNRHRGGTQQGRHASKRHVTGGEPGETRWKDLLSYKLMANELVPVCTPEKSARLHTPADLADEILLHTTSNPDFWRIWLQAAGVPQLENTRGMHYQASLLTYEAALEGLGVAIAQKALVQKELEEGRLVMPFELTVDLGDETYYFVVPQTSYERGSRELNQFRSWVASCGL